MVVHRSGRAHHAGKSERAEPELVRSVQDPRTATAVTVEPHAQVAVVCEGDGVLSLVDGTVLTPDDKEELVEYLRVADMLAVLQAKARGSLKRAGSFSPF